MKKILLRNFLILTIVSLFMSCERDDICAEATPTTPKLVIDFFFEDNPSTLRNVVDLEVREVGKDSSDSFGVFNASRIAIPLRTDAIETRYIFNLNSLDESGGRTDTIIFSYGTETLYVNRACGFKVNFIDFDGRLENSENNPDRWIGNIIINESIIEDESEAHLSVFY